MALPILSLCECSFYIPSCTIAFARADRFAEVGDHVLRCELQLMRGSFNGISPVLGIIVDVPEINFKVD